MSKRRCRGILSGTGGMTLVEVLTSFAIVVICTSMLVVTFGAAMNLMKMGSRLSENGDAAFTMIESGNSVDSSGQLTFTAGGVSFTADGTFSTSTSGSKNAVTFTEFSAAD